MLILLDKGPLESMDGVSFQEGFILGGCKWSARTPFGLDREIRFRDSKRHQGRSGLVRERRRRFESRGIFRMLSQPGGI